MSKVLVDRDRVVESMCLTWRHDFGLYKLEGYDFCSGMTDKEREHLRGQMGKLFDHHFAPALSAVTAERDRLKEEMGILWKKLDKFDSQSHGITALAENERLSAEVDALRVALLGIAQVNPAERCIEWAKSYASDGLSGTGSELYIRWLETFKEAEALRKDADRRATLSQQPEPTDTYTAVDMATAAAQWFRDGQAAVEPAPEPRDKRVRPGYLDQAVIDRVAESSARHLEEIGRRLAEPAPAQDELLSGFCRWYRGKKGYAPLYPIGSDGAEAFAAGAEWQRSRPAQTEQQPVVVTVPKELLS